MGKAQDVETTRCGIPLDMKCQETYVVPSLPKSTRACEVLSYGLEKKELLIVLTLKAYSI